MSGHLTECGFVWGALEVTRLLTGRRGDVLLELKTPKATLEVRITKSGIVQIFDLTTSRHVQLFDSEGEQLALVPSTKVTK